MEKNSIQSQLTSDRIPGPKGSFFTGVASHLKKDSILSYLTQMRQKYGDFFHLPLPGIRLYVIGHPDGIKHVLSENASNYVRSPKYEIIKPVFGNGILTSEGEPWRKQRKLMQPAFHSKRVLDVGKITLDCTQELCHTLEGKTKTRESFNLVPHLMHLTFDIAVRALFSSALPEEKKKKISLAFDIIQDFMTDSFWNAISVPLFLPTRKNRKLKAAKKLLDEVVYELIQTRRRDGQPPEEDLLSMLMEARDENSKPMSDLQIRDEVLTLLIAGHETTANALAWTFYNLLEHPEVLKKAQEGLRNQLGTRAPALEDLPHLSYVKWIFEESMRLYPPAYFFTRSAVKEDQISGFPLQKGSVVFLSAWLVHRHPDFWEDPEKFDPERFNPERSQERHRFAFYPFGGGPHVCIGASMAMMEGQFILGTLLQKFQFQGLNLEEVTQDPVITLRLRPELRVKVQLSQTRQRQTDSAPWAEDQSHPDRPTQLRKWQPEAPI